MRTTNGKEVLTTGEVARICHVAPRTVSKWFDTGKLRGYRIPGSRDRRIPLDRLVAFMRTHGIPLAGLDGGCCRILIMDSHVPYDLTQALLDTDRYELRTAENGFEAGVIAQQFHPHVIVLDLEAGADEAATICRNIKSRDDLQAAKVIAAVADLNEAAQQELSGCGFDGFLAKPYSLRELVRSVEDVTNLVG